MKTTRCLKHIGVLSALLWALSGCEKDTGQTATDTGADTSANAGDTGLDLGTEDTAVDLSCSEHSDCAEQLHVCHQGMCQSWDAPRACTAVADCNEHEVCNSSSVCEAADADTQCDWRTDCLGQYCEIYQDLPLDTAARCKSPPPHGIMRVTGTVFDLRTLNPVPNIEISIVSAFSAVSNPVAALARPLGTGVTDENGRVVADTLRANGNPLGLVALAQGDGYFLSSTGVSSPLPGSTDYPPGAEIHDFWLVSQADLDTWTAMLETDSALADFLPLGPAGGVVGLVRDSTTGDPVVGATVSSEDPQESSAIIRYLNEEQTAFDGAATGSSGLFVILDASLGEGFDAFNKDGNPIGGNIGGSTQQSIFTLVIW